MFLIVGTTGKTQWSATMNALASLRRQGEKGVLRNPPGIDQAQCPYMKSIDIKKSIELLILKIRFKGKYNKKNSDKFRLFQTCT